MLMTTSPEQQSVVIDASQTNILRIATVVSTSPLQLSTVWQIDVHGLPTFTGALQRFEQEHGITLRGSNCVMALGGATGGDTFTPARSRWTISRAGLQAFFGCPVTIINDVVSRAWALRAQGVRFTRIRGQVQQPDLRATGRQILLVVEEGAGASVIDIDHSAHCHVLDTEAGHLEYPATSALEQGVVAALKGTSSFVTWEKVLVVDPKDPMWSTIDAGASGPERAELLANTLGRFCVNLAYAYAGWGGVFLTGSRAGKIVRDAPRAFEAAFSLRNNFARLIGDCPVWHVEQRDAVIAGAAVCLASSPRRVSA